MAAPVLLWLLPVHTGTSESRDEPSAWDSVHVRGELDISSAQLMPLVPLAGAQPLSASLGERFHSRGSAGGIEHAQLPACV